MKKIMLIFGTRPEAVKMCPLVLELKKRKSINTVVCVTGQHREMLDSVMKTFGVVADHDLDIMKDGQTLIDITDRILSCIRPILESEAPDLVLVHGDTTTAYASALACFYLGIDVGHVEAGLRTGDLSVPFPEEFNRRSIDMISKYDFAPTEEAKQNLLLEGKREDRIFVTGNTIVDALKMTLKECDSKEIALKESDNNEMTFKDSDSNEITLEEDSNRKTLKESDSKGTMLKESGSDRYLDFAKGKRLVILTLHRRENMSESKIEGIFKAVLDVVSEEPALRVIFPVHPNCMVSKYAEKMLGSNDRILLTPHLDVACFHDLLRHAFLVLTDSGGVQEETASLGIPTIVLRDSTERIEGEKQGILLVSGTDRMAIREKFSDLVKNDAIYERVKSSISNNCYGDGMACVRIADIIERNFDVK